MPTEFQKRKKNYKKRNPDIILLQETYLKPCKKFGITNYRIYWSDRLTGKGGGTAILIWKNIQHNHIPNRNTENLEHTGITIQMDRNLATTIYSAYNSPLQQIQTEDLEKLLENQDRTIIGGELNAKNKIWYAKTTNFRGRKLVKHSDKENYFITAPKEPTHYPSNNIGNPDILDIFILENIKENTKIYTEAELTN